MKPKSKPKFDFAGVTEEGKHLYVECSDKPERRVFEGVPADPGKPAPLGAELATVHPTKDGHFTIEPLRGGDGPAQVATVAYRDG